MKTLLNLTKVRSVRLYEADDLVVKLLIYYYDGEPYFEYECMLTDLCLSSKTYEKEKVEKAYNDIKQALLKGGKYVEIEL